MKFLTTRRRSIPRIAALILTMNILLFFPGTVGGISAQTRNPKENPEYGTDRDLSVQGLLVDYHALESALPPLELDSNGDGQTDYTVRTHVKTGDKMIEILDFNHDGRMDDFYYYEGSILRERAVDSNYDGFVDLWVYIEEGVYIAYYEKDTDFDGKMDELKRYKENDGDE